MPPKCTIRYRHIALDCSIQAEPAPFFVPIKQSAGPFCHSTAYAPFCRTEPVSSPILKGPQGVKECVELHTMTFLKGIFPILPVNVPTSHPTGFFIFFFAIVPKKCMRILNIDGAEQQVELEVISIKIKVLLCSHAVCMFNGMTPC